MAANDIYAYRFTRRLAELLEIDEARLIDTMRAALYESSSKLATFHSDGSVDVEGCISYRKERADFAAAAKRLGRLTQ